MTTARVEKSPLMKFNSTNAKLVSATHFAATGKTKYTMITKFGNSVAKAKNNDVLSHNPVTFPAPNTRVATAVPTMPTT